VLNHTQKLYKKFKLIQVFGKGVPFL